MFVVDLVSTLPDGPEGDERTPAAWAPRSSRPDGDPSALDFTGTPEPVRQRCCGTTLIEGTGAPVEEGPAHRTSNYLGQVYGSEKPFDESYSRGTPFDFVIGAGPVIQGWDEGLIGVEVGSRVDPADPAGPGLRRGGPARRSGIAGTDTMYFVVDVLAADLTGTDVMSVPKSERLLNLLIMLLVQRRYVAKERIREILYPGSSDDAFEKMFERDKEELRSLGVPIEVGSLDAYFDDEPGYRIRPDEFALPEISLDRRRGGRARAGRQGLGARPAGRGDHRGAAQADGGRAAGRRVGAGRRPAATGRRRARLRRVLGGHRRADPGRVRVRPHRCSRRPPATCSRGAWCATPGAGTPSAWTPTVAPSGSSGSPGSQGTPRRDGPAGLVRGAARHRRTRGRPAARARAAGRAGRACWSGRGPAWACVARRPASRTGVAGPDGTTAWDRLHLLSGAVADEVLTYGPDACVVSPAWLRDSVVAARLRAVVQGRRRECAGGRRRQGAGGPAADAWCPTCTPAARCAWTRPLGRSASHRTSCCATSGCC